MYNWACPETRNLKPEARNPKPEIRDLHPKFQTQNSQQTLEAGDMAEYALQSVSPKLQNLLNPKPQPQLLA